MRSSTFFFSVFLIVTSIHKPLAAEGSNWTNSQLSQITMETARSTTQKYHRCLDKELAQIALNGKDPRTVTDLILKKCGHELIPIRQAFDKEHVPSVVTNQYLRRIRTQAARKFLQVVLFSQASLSGPPD